MRIDVAYASDNNYALYTAVSICSLFENNRNVDSLYVHVINNGMDDINAGKIKSIADRYNRALIFYSCSELFQELSITVKLKSTQTITAFGSVFLTRILPGDIKSVIYLDGDSLVLGSLDRLSDYDLNQKIIWGVEDNSSKSDKIALKGNADLKYINSGMLYMNLDKIRCENIHDQIIDFINNELKYFKHNDQAVINAVFKNDIGILPPKFNAMTFMFERPYYAMVEISELDDYYSEEEIIEAINSPVFVHFTPSGSKRPWVKGCRHPLKEEWFKYLQLSKWGNFTILEDQRRRKYKLLDLFYLYCPVRLYKGVINLRNIMRNKPSNEEMR